MDVDSSAVLFGSICSGLGTDKFGADEVIGPSRHQHVFTCEIDKVVRSLSEQNCRPQYSFGDVRHSDFVALAPSCHVLSGGFPCEPFSAIGAHGGMNDPRASVIKCIAMYISKHRPTVVILGNVRGLLLYHGEDFVAILEMLKGIKGADGEPAYFLHWKLLDQTKFTGIPAARARIWIVMIKRGSTQRTPFKWPARMPCADLDAFLDPHPKLESYKRYPVPKQITNSARIKSALTKVKENCVAEGVPPESIPCIVDVEGAKDNIGFRRSPCLTKSRCRSFSLHSLQHNKALSLNAMLRLQGFGDVAVLREGVSDSAMAAAVGNAFNLRMYTMILRSALAAAGIHG